MVQEEYRTRSCAPVASCPGWSTDRSATSCHSILDCNPLAPTGYYWITNGAQPHIMYCYMEADKCGVRGVMRVAHIDMTISSINCPAPLNCVTSVTGVLLPHHSHILPGGLGSESVCGSHRQQPTTLRHSLAAHHFSYQHVCGRVLGPPTMGCVHVHCVSFVIQY